jgi:hypothetical protein
MRPWCAAARPAMVVTFARTVEWEGTLVTGRNVAYYAFALTMALRLDPGDDVRREAEPRILRRLLIEVRRDVERKRSAGRDSRPAC